MLITQRVNRSSIVGKNEKSKSSWNISCSLQSFLSCDGGNCMRELNRAIAFAKGKKVMTTLVVKNAKSQNVAEYHKKYGKRAIYTKNGVEYVKPFIRIRALSMGEI